MAAHHPRQRPRSLRHVAHPAAGGAGHECSPRSIVYRVAVPVLTLLQNERPEAVAALAPSIVRIMLAAAVEVIAEEVDTTC